MYGADVFKAKRQVLKMDPTFWGPGLWKFLHSTAAVAYTDADRDDFHLLVKALARTLPCSKCREHFRNNLGNIPIENYMSSNETMFMWTYLMHDAVNKAQGKTGSQRPTFEQAYRIYFQVGDDSGADFVGDYQNEICQEVCAEAKAHQVSASRRRETNSEKYTSARKYKPRQ